MKILKYLKEFKDNDKKWTILMFFGLLGIVAATILVQREIKLRSRAGIGPAVLMVVPPAQEKNVGDMGSLNISLNPNGVGASGVELVMVYDSSVVEVTDIRPGEFFTNYGTPVEIMKDLTPGRIYYAVAFPLGSNHTSLEVNDVAVITFTTKAQGSTDFAFVTTGTPWTVVTDATGADRLDRGIDGTISVNDLGGANLSFSGPLPPNPQNVGFGFSAEVYVNTAGQEIYGVDARIKFDPLFLEATWVDEGAEQKFTSYPVLDYDNAAGTVSISANIGGGTSAVNGDMVSVGRMTFRVKQYTQSTDLNFDFELGDLNDSNIVLAGSQGEEPVDILESVGKLAIVINEDVSTPTPTPTTPPTTPPTSPPTTPPTSPPTTPPTTPPTPDPYVNRVVKIGFQGRRRQGASNQKEIEVRYKNADTSVISSWFDYNTNVGGEFIIPLQSGRYQILINTSGYLARRYDNVFVTPSDNYLDLSNVSLLGGDYNGDGEINEVDYVTRFLPSFMENDPLIDLDGSGQVNNLDFAIMRSNWNLINDTF